MHDSKRHHPDLHSIDEVIERLDAIVNRSKEQQSRLGYFAALYRQVTIAVRDRIRAGGFFDDDQRMERLDVLFALRYLDAIDSWSENRPTTGAWRFAFRVCPQWSPIVLQHLLLGINAHINLDLGIATAATVRSSSELPDLQNDFHRINDLLASMVQHVEAQLAEIWPLFRWFDSALGNLDEKLANFKIRRAREQAWQVAQRLAAIDETDRAAEIVGLDSKVVRLARRIRYPGLHKNATLKLIRVGELRSTASIIEVLER